MSEQVNINVNETNENINITSTEIVEVIDINVGETIEEVTLNITEEVIQVNINKVTGGGSQDLQEVTDLGANTTNQMQINGVNVATINDIPTNTSDLINDSNFVSDASYVHTDNNFTTTLKNKLDGIAEGAEVNVNADWNATSGDAQILNKPTIPNAVIIDTVPTDGSNNAVSSNGVFDALSLKQNSLGFIPENVSNKQNSLNIDGTGIKYPTVDAVNTALANINTNAIDKFTVKLSQAINKGQAVYVSNADGTNIIVSKASNTSEATSSKTVGLLETTGAINAFVNVVTNGLLTGLNTSTATIGDPVWLGTNGDLIYGLTNKPYAPAHLVYIGVVTRVNINNGEILVNVQNGFELKEIHDIDLISSSPTNNQGLIYESSTSLWKNKTIDKTFVGLGNVDNTSDINKPVSTAQATAIGLKENTITAGTTAQYYRGDKTFQTLDKTAVGLANVDNTSDANKPVSTATQTALNLKQNASTRRNANNTSNNNINYCGVALGTGISESSAVWTITRLTIAASGSVTTATATNVAWTNRQSATYI